MTNTNTTRKEVTVTKTWADDSDEVEKTVSAGGIIADTEITFVNNKGGALPTGLFPDSLPMKLLMALSALLILVFAG